MYPFYSNQIPCRTKFPLVTSQGSNYNCGRHTHTNKYIHTYKHLPAHKERYICIYNTDEFERCVKVYFFPCKKQRERVGPHTHTQRMEGEGEGEGIH